MGLARRYNPQTAEPRLQAFWQASGTYDFPQAPGPVYAIDTPPPTVSGHLHLGHAYSYSQTDFVARFWRMNGCHVFYPMGYDDNGLPTERYVERLLGVTAAQVGRQAFAQRCMQVSVEAEKDYTALWQRLGLSIDWRYTYRTIEPRAIRIAQRSFLNLYRRKLAYRRQAPAIWCPECGTAIAQAELDDLERESAFYTLAFRLPNGEALPIATTRPELLPACVAVFVHPDDNRFRALAGQQVTVPLFGQQVPLLQDPGADPQKGTGVVMCCTFGDVADVAWWHAHRLPLVETVAPDGRLTAAAGAFAGLPVDQARLAIVQALQERGLLLDQQPIVQSVRVHERCDTPVEYMITPQWFIRVLDFKDALIQAGEQIAWHPPHMGTRYRHWVENLSWDWCISRQRPMGVPFPVWYCQACGQVTLAEEGQLPMNPASQAPPAPCACGSARFVPETGVMDTWATSSLSPQIVGHWPPGESDPPSAEGGLYARVFPMSLRPQAHDIIRTWAFYTIVQSFHHFGTLPWKDVAISGWGIAGEGMGKISKSRGGGPVAPMEVIARYSADAVRYWAASTGLGKDAVISEDKIQVGARLVNKLWNVARFSEPFLAGGRPAPPAPQALSPADRWVLARTQRLVRRASDLFRGYDHAAAKSEVEAFFWQELADNYLEMCKLRLYDEASAAREGARYALYHTLLAALKLFAPFLPYVTEAIYRELFAAAEGSPSIHTARWPDAVPEWEDEESERAGEELVHIATAVRRFKSAHNLPLSAGLARLQLATGDPALHQALHAAAADLRSVTRARQVEVGQHLDAELEAVQADGQVAIALAVQPPAAE